MKAAESGEREADGEAEDAEGDDESGDGKGKKKTLLENTRQSRRRSQGRRIDPLIGRSTEITRTIQVPVADGKITRSMLGTPASARPHWPRAWPGKSRAAKCPRSSKK